MVYDPFDYYNRQAKKKGYEARSAFKLEEIQNKFHIFGSNTRKVLDIGCAPGSWIQYVRSKIKSDKLRIVGLDIKDVNINLPGVTTYIQDISDVEKVKEILKENDFEKIDLIQSDMAPNTVGLKDLDAIRSIGLLEETLWIYKQYLAKNGNFVIKIFMGPGFEEFVADLKNFFGGKNIKIFKPKSCRAQSKEIYIIGKNNS